MLKKTTDWRRNYGQKYFIVSPHSDKIVALEQISGLADVLTVLHTSATTPAARALEQATVDSQVPSNHAGTVSDETNETIHLTSMKGLEPWTALGGPVRQ